MSDDFGAWQRTDATIMKTVQQLQAEGVATITWRGKAGCEHCKPNDGVTRKVGEPFPNGCLIPPAHPNCNCTYDKETSMATDTKKTGKFRGKSNKLGHGGRAAQLKARGVPQAVIGMIARRKHAAPGQANYHGK